MGTFTSAVVGCGLLNRKLRSDWPVGKLTKLSKRSKSEKASWYGRYMLLEALILISQEKNGTTITGEGKESTVQHQRLQ